MAPRRTVAIVAAALVVAAAGVMLALAFGGGDDGSDEEAGDDGVRIVQPGAPGDTTRELSAGDVAALDTPAHNAADTAFMQHMIVHHAQALEMAALVESHTDSDDLPLLAERITASQEAEIELIEQWLTERGESVADVHQAHELMPGMATPEQMAELGAATGIAFDAMFLDLMIAHHQGALTMVEELYAAGGGLEPAADHFARGVEADQSIEIARMTELRAARGS